MKSLISLFSALVLVSAAAGCGDGSSSSTGGGGGSGGSGGGPSVEPVPILEKTPAITHTCVETRAMTQELGVMSGRVEGLVELGGTFFELRSEEKLTVAALGLDGQLGDPVDLETDPFAFRAPTLASDGQSLAAVWSAPGETILFARMDETPALVAGPTEIPVTSASQTSASALVPDGAGYVLFYGATSGSDTELLFLRLDADGAAMGEPVSIGSVGETYIAQMGVAPTGDGGFALAYSKGHFGQTEVNFTILNADGTPRFPARRISAAASTEVASRLTLAPRQSVVKVGEQYWVAFTETNVQFEVEKGYTIIRLAVVESDGSAVLHSLEAPVDQDEAAWPSFVPFDGKVGLTWTKGHIIWICGGCITDHDMHFVLLDPAALAPASEVATHVHKTNGIVAPLIARSGADLATASGLDFHALSLPASGAMRCDPAP
ncbi:MAG: hypothetical protein IPK82_34050 [Polyangiaceae bacterium]|nr:hypothetical protein [Polyangiaceae bacterium]